MVEIRRTLELVAGRGDLIIGQPDEYHFPPFSLMRSLEQRRVLEKANRLAFLTTPFTYRRARRSSLVNVRWRLLPRSHARPTSSKREVTTVTLPQRHAFEKEISLLYFYLDDPILLWTRWTFKKKKKKKNSTFLPFVPRAHSSPW